MNYGEMAACRSFCIALLVEPYSDAGEFRALQCSLVICAVYLIAFPFRHEFDGAVEALFELDHGVDGEGILDRSVCRANEIGRAAHCALHGAEPFDPVLCRRANIARSRLEKVDRCGVIMPKAWEGPANHRVQRRPPSHCSRYKY